MKRVSPMQKAVCLVLVTTQALLAGCGSCGFDCGDDDGDRGPALLDLGFTDESVEQLKQVVIEVDRITLRRSGAADVIIDTFTIEDLGLVAADSFQVDLLQYRGRNQLRVLEDLELEPGTYSDMRIDILDGDINRSYVQESGDDLKPLNLDSGSLSLSGFELSPGDESFAVVFSLAQSVRYREAADDYLLSADGVRVIDSARAASISGRVDRELFDTAESCSGKTDPEIGNRVYIYRLASQGSVTLADVHTDASSTEVPDNTQAPFSVAALAEDVLTGNWQYAFGFLPAGDYVLAFSCDTEDDDPVDYDGFVVPLPDSQVYEIELSEGERTVCDLAPEASCT
jgi:hypothetical protein